MSCFQLKLIWHCERTTFALQKGSFYCPKGVLLQSKTSPFAARKESFCSPKGVLLKCWGGVLGHDTWDMSRCERGSSGCLQGT